MTFPLIDRGKNLNLIWLNSRPAGYSTKEEFDRKGVLFEEEPLPQAFEAGLYEHVELESRISPFADASEYKIPFSTNPVPDIVKPTADDKIKTINSSLNNIITKDKRNFIGWLLLGATVGLIYINSN